MDRIPITAAPVIQLMNDVIQEEESCEILQINLKHMPNLLLDMTIATQNQSPEATREAPIWLQLLYNCLTEAKSILYRYDRPQRCLHCLITNSGRLSKEVKEWKVLFNYVFQHLQGDLPPFHGVGEVVIAPVIAPVIPLMKDVIEEEGKRHILQTELRSMENLLLDISFLFQDQEKAAPETLKICLQLLHNSLTQAKTILQGQQPGDSVMCNPGSLSKEVKEWKVQFNNLFQGLQRYLSLFVTAPQIINRDPNHPIPSEESVQPLPKDEAWKLFRSIAFKDNHVSMDIEEYARNIADECKGLPLGISLVAAAMKGKTRVDEWKTSLSSIKNTDLSLPDTPLHPELYQLFKWSYDALPCSNVKNCFLYCAAMYPESAESIPVEELVRRWIAEGLVVRSRQATHLMDMAIGHSYLNLLADRGLFQIVRRAEIFPNSSWGVSYQQFIRVHDIIREMALYIVGKEENCLFKEGHDLQNFRNCKRMLLLEIDIRNLLNELTCPELVSLCLSSSHIEQLPSRFLDSLTTSLKVLDLSGNYRMTSIPSSVGQLKQLEFLSLRGNYRIEVLPQEICSLSSLQFLDLSYCYSLQSLPSRIGGLKNLKILNLCNCNYLSMIPLGLSQLTSLITLDVGDTSAVNEMWLSLNAESEKSICRLKGLRNLAMLRIQVLVDVQEGMTSSGIEVGIMGTWVEMRHLQLSFFPPPWEFEFGYDSVMDDLPHDLQSMSQLQKFVMWDYHGLSLPDYTCNFQHLQYLELNRCQHLRKLSPLERLPNLKYLQLREWPNLKDLDIGNSGRRSGFLMLEELVLLDLEELESIAVGVWNERTLPRLRNLKIRGCPLLKRLPVGMHKLLNFSKLDGEYRWWQQLIWEDYSMKIHLEKSYQYKF